MIKKFLLLLSLTCALSFSDTAGPNSCATFADDATVGTKTWSNTGNVASSDNVRASVNIDNNGISHYLKATNCGFSIPVNATINGIKVEWEVRQGSGVGLPQDFSVRIVKGGSISTTNMAIGNNPLGTDAYISYGGVSSLWGETWTYSDINASTFGAVYSAQEMDNATMNVDVDHVRITVTYTPASAAALYRMFMVF